MLAAIQLKAQQTTAPGEFGEFCKGKIARYKISGYQEFVESFPMTASGTIQSINERSIFPEIFSIDIVRRT